MHKYPLHQKWEFSRQISEYPLPLGSGNLQLEQTQFPVFSQDFLIRCAFPDRDFFGHFSCFLCAVGTLLSILMSELPLLTDQKVG